MRPPASPAGWDGGGVPPPLLSRPPSPRPAEAVRRASTTPTPPAPTANSLPHVLLLMLQPWKCTDETMEIVIARSHLEVKSVEGSRCLPASPGGGVGSVASCSGCSRGVAWGCPQLVSDRWVLFSQPIKDVVNITLRDISCQAEKNATHFMLKTPLNHCGTSLEGKGHANNEVRGALARGAAPSPADAPWGP